MFIGHIALSLAAKRAVPSASLGTLVGAALFVDLLWPLFLLAGWETVRIAPGITAVTPLDFTHYPWTHSLAMTVVWAILFAVTWQLAGRGRRSNADATWMGALVASHWVLDALSHRPDLPLVPGHPALVGLGLWDSLPATMAVETLMFVVGCRMYLWATRVTTEGKRWAFWAFAIGLYAIYLGNLFGPPPPSPEGLAWFGLLAWLLPLWAGWTDRQRREAAGGYFG